MRLLYFIILSFFLFPSCATIFTTRYQKVKIDSYPQGAHVRFEGEEIGLTPCKVRVKKKREGYEPEFDLVLENHKKAKIKLESTSNPIIILNVLNLGIGYLVDLSTGAWFYYKKDFYSLDLEKAMDN
jgi:hypothetical protein